VHLLPRPDEVVDAALCFGLRRGSSLVEHLLALGHPTYLVDRSCRSAP
jgi:hypothetical protein